MVFAGGSTKVTAGECPHAEDTLNMNVSVDVSSQNHNNVDMFETRGILKDIESYTTSSSSCGFALDDKSSSGEEHEVTLVPETREDVHDGRGRVSSDTPVLFSKQHQKIASVGLGLSHSSSEVLNVGKVVDAAGYESGTSNKNANYLVRSRNSNSGIMYDVKDEKTQSLDKKQLLEPFDRVGNISSNISYKRSSLKKSFSEKDMTSVKYLIDNDNRSYRRGSGGAIVLYKDHWLEAADKKHRCGSHLQIYHRYWVKEELNNNCDATCDKVFFEWLDRGAGKDVDLEKCSRRGLESNVVQYCTAQQRKKYQVVVVDGLLTYKNRFISSLNNKQKDTDNDVAVDKAKFAYKDEYTLLDSQTILDPKLYDNNANLSQPIPIPSKVKANYATKHIFVWGVDHKLYVAKKIEGQFHHSSFFGGGAVLAAGRFVVEFGKLKSIAPHSGHYRTSPEHFSKLLEHLKASEVDMQHVNVEWYKTKKNSKQHHHHHLP